MKQEIGGFFELELHWGGQYHPDAIKVNSGSKALEYILKARKYRKLYISYYNCDCLVELLEKLGGGFEYYDILYNLYAAIISYGNKYKIIYIKS